MATLEEAQRCPKCQEMGEIRKEVPQNNKTKLLHIYCNNTRCNWYDTSWNVSVLEDGSIPDAQNFAGKKKDYQGFEHDNAEAQRVMNYLTELELDSRKGRVDPFRK